MKILFHIRADAKIKSGGDLSLIKIFKKMLEQNGFFVDIAFDVNAKLNGYDAAMTINIDRPYEPFYFVQKAKKYGCPVSIYTLHHPFSGVADFLRFGVSGVKKIVSITSRFDPLIYEQMLTQTKIILNKSGYNQNFISPSIRDMQHAIMRDCSLIVGCCQKEINQIESDLDYQVDPDKVYILPHSYEKTNAKEVLNNKIKGLIVCAGRFESRKNQLAVMHLAKKFPEKFFWFVGGVNPSEKNYFNKIQSESIKYSNVRIYSDVPYSDYKKILSQAEVFISASWFEVVSLVEIDAYLSGCKLVVGRNSYLTEFISEGIFPFSIQSEIDMASALTSSLDDSTIYTNNRHVSNMQEDYVKNLLIGLFKKLTDAQNS